MSVTVFPKGTTIYYPDKCWNGYTLILVPGPDGNDAGLIDMNGQIVHRWPLRSGGKRHGFPRLRLQPDGRVLVQRSVGNRIKGYAQEFDWNGELAWEYSPPAGFWPHHDIEKTASGNILLVCRELVPESIRCKAKDLQRREKLYADVIQEISPHKLVVWEWHQYEHIDIERKMKTSAAPDWSYGAENNTPVDWTHTNTIQALPPNHWFDAGDTRFKPGNLLMSLRQLDVLFIVDRDTKEIVWEYMGDYRGGLSGQHDSHMIEKGLPGEGNILVFDNGASPTVDLAHSGCSYVLEIDPTTKKTVWVYDKSEKLFSRFTSSCQRLPNGNTLILEATHSRLFEVTCEGETVWEYVFGWSPHSVRAYRYAYDFCPQTKALPRPEERRVDPAY